LRSPDPGSASGATSVAPELDREPKTLTPSERVFFEQPYIGVATTLRKDGSPHTTPLWVDVDDRGVSFNTAWPRSKPRHLERDPRSLSSSSIRATATAGSRPAESRPSPSRVRTSRSTASRRKYNGDESYRGHKPGETRVSVRITPTRIESRGLD